MTERDTPLHVVVAGGGIGGLTTALCLHHFGCSVTLIERAAELGEVGAGIQISPNAMRVFQALGLVGQISDAGFLPLSADLREGISGREVASMPLGDAAKGRWGAPYIHIHRADLIAILADAVQTKMPAALRTGAAVLGYRNDMAGAVLSTDVGEVRGDVVIAADGIQSVLRAQMLPDTAPRFTGHAAWRAVVPVERLGGNVPPPAATVWMGGGKHAVTYLLRGGQLANFVGVVERSDWTEESWTAKGSRDQALADFDGWHPVVTNMLRRADAHYCWAIYDRRPPAIWHDGRAVLLGDACHPMSPFMAQGAAMAIEDGYVLARLLAQGNIDAALQNYTAKRRNRVARVINSARGNARMFHRSHARGHTPLRRASRAFPDFGAAQFDWLYGHDVTAP